MANKDKKPKKISDITPFEAAAENNGVDNIVNSIINTARNSAKVIVDEAKANVDNNVNSEMAKVEEYCVKLVTEAEIAATDLLRHRVMLAEMDVKKYTQKSRQDMIDRVYCEAEKSIVSATAKYTAFLEAVISNYAENGDEVIASENDKKLVTAEFVKRLSEKSKKKFVLHSEYGSFGGGVILRSKGYDKNFTVSSIIKEMRAGTEADVAGILFGGSK